MFFACLCDVVICIWFFNHQADQETVSLFTFIGFRACFHAGHFVLSFFNLDQ